MPDILSQLADLNPAPEAERLPGPAKSEEIYGQITAQIADERAGRRGRIVPGNFVRFTPQMLVRVAMVAFLLMLSAGGLFLISKSGSRSLLRPTHNGGHNGHGNQGNHGNHGSNRGTGPTPVGPDVPAPTNGEWTYQPNLLPQDATAGGSIGGISCVSADFCMAVGGWMTQLAGSATAGHALAELWNGHDWAVLATPAPEPALRVEMSSVSCPSVDWCVAVGSGDPSTGYHHHAVTEFWDGTSWSLGTTPNPGSLGTDLAFVSCPNTTFCMAVGESYVSRGAVALMWNGSVWTSVAVPEPSPTSLGIDRSNYLPGVSCVSASDCVAVGNYTHAKNQSSNEALVMRWDGSSWRQLTTPAQPANSWRTLSAVSCTGAVCWAAGQSEIYHGTSATGIGIIERIVGDSVTLVPSPDVDSQDSLFGISCAANECTASGSYQDASISNHTLIEHWDGSSWSLDTNVGGIPDGGNPSPSTISCVSAKDCFVVGEYAGTVYSTMPLIVRN
ncbi:MAG TPA: hypothetical protein VGS21_04905 [Acidimicrobiales bacterium]|nr:hypothetical protein [Acidimicrobiales bacterium]